MLPYDLRKMIKGADFGTALEFVKQGYSLKRKMWKSNYYIVLKDNVICVNDEGVIYPWSPEQRHIMAMDWEFYLGEEV